MSNNPCGKCWTLLDMPCTNEVLVGMYACYLHAKPGELSTWLAQLELRVRLVEMTLEKKEMRR